MNSVEERRTRALSLATELFGPLIADLTSRAQAFEVPADEVDDEILDLFAEQVREIAESARTTAAAADEMGVRRGAHSLQGMSGTIGVATLSVVGVELSSAAKAHDFGRCGQLADALRRWQEAWSAA